MPPAFTYEKSLTVLSMAREAALVTKSNLILGMGEREEEIAAAITDLHDAGCDILTITQYLRPSPTHHPIARWVKPEEFVHWSTFAQDLGFKGVMAGPLVRRSLPSWPTVGGGNDSLGSSDPRAPSASRRRARHRPVRKPPPSWPASTPYPQECTPPPLAARDRSMSDTRKTGRIAQIRDAYRAIKSIDPSSASGCSWPPCSPLR